MARVLCLLSIAFCLSFSGCNRAALMKKVTLPRCAVTEHRISETATGYDPRTVSFECGPSDSERL
jgi:hypothetical protein